MIRAPSSALKLARRRLFVAIAAMVLPSAAAIAARKGSKRVGGSGSSGKGSRYVGGTK
jgi:hypothetical protein